MNFTTINCLFGANQSSITFSVTAQPAWLDVGKDVILTPNSLVITNPSKGLVRTEQFKVVLSNGGANLSNPGNVIAVGQYTYLTGSPTDQMTFVYDQPTLMTVATMSGWQVDLKNMDNSDYLPPVQFTLYFTLSEPQSGGGSGPVGDAIPQGGPLTEALNADGFRITGLDEPALASDAATMNYVGVQIGGANTYADNAANTALTTANAYADTVGANANSYTDTAASATLTTANNYTDSKFPVTVQSIDTTGGDLNMNGNRVYGIPDTPAGGSDAVNKLYVQQIQDTLVAGYIGYTDGKFPVPISQLNFNSGSANGDLKMNSVNRVTQLPTPSLSTDAANKQYVDDGDVTVQTNAYSYTDSAVSGILTSANAYTDAKFPVPVSNMNFGTGSANNSLNMGGGTNKIYQLANGSDPQDAATMSNLASAVSSVSVGGVYPVFMKFKVELSAPLNDTMTVTPLGLDEQPISSTNTVIVPFNTQTAGVTNQVTSFTATAGIQTLHGSGVSNPLGMVQGSTESRWIYVYVFQHPTDAGKLNTCLSLDWYKPGAYVINNSLLATQTPTTLYGSFFTGSPRVLTCIGRFRAQFSGIAWSIVTTPQLITSKLIPHSDWTSFGAVTSAHFSSTGGVQPTITSSTSSGITYRRLGDSIEFAIFVNGLVGVNPTGNIYLNIPGNYFIKQGVGITATDVATDSNKPLSLLPQSAGVWTSGGNTIQICQAYAYSFYNRVGFSLGASAVLWTATGTQGGWNGGTWAFRVKFPVEGWESDSFSYSDMRLKDYKGPFQIIDEDWELAPIKYTYKDRPDILQMGFSAQQISKKFAEYENCVWRKDSQGLILINEQKLLPILTFQINNLKERVKDLEAYVGNRRKRVEFEVDTSEVPTPCCKKVKFL